MEFYHHIFFSLPWNCSQDNRSNIDIYHCWGYHYCRNLENQGFANWVLQHIKVRLYRSHFLLCKIYPFFRAPTDCYQYLTGVSGSLTSLNYPTAVLEITRYTACVRREAGYCGIQWSQTQQTSGDSSIAGITPDPFSLDAILTTGNAVRN